MIKERGLNKSNYVFITKTRNYNGTVGSRISSDCKAKEHSWYAYVLCRYADRIKIISKFTNIYEDKFKFTKRFQNFGLNEGSKV